MITIQRLFTLSACLLLLVNLTLQHEHKRQNQPHKRSMHPLTRNHHQFLHRSNDQEQTCGWVCPSQSEDIKIILNTENYILGMVNITAKFAIAFDYRSSLVAMFNGIGNSATVIDLTTDTLVNIINHNNNSLLWKADKCDFEKYIKKVTCLKDIFKFGLQQGSAAYVQSAPTALQVSLGKLFIAFGAVIGDVIKEDLSDSFDWMSLGAKRLNRALKTNLNGLAKVVEKTTITTSISLASFIEYIEGLSGVIQHFDGQLKVFEKNHIKIDLKKLLNQKSGLEAVTYILGLFKDCRVNLATVAKTLLTPQELLKAVDNFSGLVSKGYRSYVLAMGKIVGTAYKKVPPQQLILSLIRVTTTFTFDNKMKQQAQQSGEKLYKCLEKINKNNEISELVEFQKKLVEHKLKANGIDVSKLIDVLDQVGQKEPLEIITKIIVELKPAVSTEKLIVRLLLTMTEALNRGNNIRKVQLLVPNIEIKNEIVSSNNDKLLTEILKGVNKEELKGDGNKVDLNKLLQKLPVIKDIYKAIDAALSKACKDTHLSSILEKVDVKSDDDALRLVVTIGTALNIELVENSTQQHSTVTETHEGAESSSSSSSSSSNESKSSEEDGGHKGHNEEDKHRKSRILSGNHLKHGKHLNKANH